MKHNIILIILIIISLPLAALVLWLWPEPEFTPPAGYSTLPSQTETLPETERDTIQTGNGVSIVSPDSIGQSISETESIFEISDEPNTTDTRFSIVYYAGYDFFQVSLETEPLAETRRLAEQKLLAQLQISEAEACELDVSVRTRVEVSEFYAGTELGLSFCPGAIQL